MLFKVLSNGYILGVGIGEHGVEITQEEYDRITELMHNKPKDTEQIEYKLSESYEWEACEIPTISDDDELTDEQTCIVLTGGEL